MRRGNGLAHGTGALVRADHPWGDAELARLYDAFVFDADLPLYLELAAAQGRRVLEVACGSGRVMVPLVRAGFDVVGIDASPHMLALARDKLRSIAALGAHANPLNGRDLGEPDSARPERAHRRPIRRVDGTLHGAGGRARLVQADMRDFSLAEAGFDLAIVAVKSFAYLTERDDQARCLGAIARHLRPGGLLAIDFLHPQPGWVGAPPGSMQADLLQHVAERGFTLSRVESVVSTDLARQMRVIRSAYEVIDDSGHVLEKRFVEWSYRWTYRFEAEHLLERAGLKIEVLHGGYAREPFTSTSEAMVFLARK